MKKYRFKPALNFIPGLIILVALTAAGCGDTKTKSSTPSWDDSKVTYTNETLTDSYTGSVDQVFYPVTEGNVELTYTLDLNSQKNVYFVFSNSNTDSAATLPYSPNIRSADSEFQAGPAARKKMPAPPAGLRGMPEIDEFKRGALNLLERGARSALDPALAGEPAMTYTSGSELTFKTNDGDVTAVCRLTRTVEDKTLYIWVADSEWGTMPGKVTDALVQEMADAFLLTGSDKIYQWITGIYGSEWGTYSGYTNLIASDQPIHILLYDISGDGGPEPDKSYILGYYWPKDNYKKTTVKNSNEKIMFYMDSALFSSGKEYWKNEIISTLAHEFQHMIHFYQKTVLKGATSDTWLDEMCSLMAEDFAADKLHLDGPRGVLYTDYTGGNSGNNQGRLPLFNYNNETPVTAWLEDDELLFSYSTAYAFGAYLARNFGGAVLFRNIVQNPYGDYRAVTTAIPDADYKNFQALLRDWGVSVVLSDKTGVLPGSLRYGYNKDDADGGKYSSSVDTMNYSLGSINLYNYEESESGHSGPWFYPGIAGEADIMNQGSNFYSYMGQLFGSHKWTIRLRTGVSLTVVVRD